MDMRSLQRSLIFFLFSLLPAMACLAQDWMPAEDGNGFYIQRQFFQRLELVFRGIDSADYLLTAHSPDAYWKNKNEDKREMVVSRVEKAGRPVVVKQLEAFAAEPVLRSFNQKYYVLDNYFKLKKKQFYYECFVYSKDWVLESVIRIEHQAGQMGFMDFVVDGGGYMYLITKPYFTDHKPNSFRGASLIKLDPKGSLLKLRILDMSYGQDLKLENNALFFTLAKQKLIYPVFQTDSLQNWKSDLDLNAFVLSSKASPVERRIYRQKVSLNNGHQLVYYDSTWSSGPQSLATVSKIALLNPAGQKVWIREPGERWLFDKPVALSNGEILIQIDKRWTTTELIRIGADGKETLVKSLPLVIDSKADRYRFDRYFEWTKGEILFFYTRETPQRQERLYVERAGLR